MPLLQHDINKRFVPAPCDKRCYLLRNSKAAVVFLLIILSFSKAKAQEAADYSIHANIIYHFTKYINWPAHKKTGDFVIGVVGESQIYPALVNSLANKKVGDQKIVIKQFTSVSSIASCHIIFICNDESYLIRKVTERTVNTHTLVVSESEGLGRKGSCINFVIIGDRLKLEINKQNIEKRSLGIASELLKLGRTIN